MCPFLRGSIRGQPDGQEMDKTVLKFEVKLPNKKLHKAFCCSDRHLS